MKKVYFTGDASTLKKEVHCDTLTYQGPKTHRFFERLLEKGKLGTLTTSVGNSST